MNPELNREYPELDDPEVVEQMVKLTVGHMAKIRHGVFGEPGRAFDALVRFSNSQSTFEKDSTGAARGLAIKGLDVCGPRAVPDDGDGTQNFSMVDHPVFPFPGPQAYVELARPRHPLRARLTPSVRCGAREWSA